MDFSLWQIAIVLVIALLVFGPKRLPELGKSLGSGMKEFKDSITGGGKDDEEDEKPEIETTSPTTTDKVEAEVVTEHKA
ncbi:MAG: Sec-independent protein translocase subunit TatA/TatB [Solirubrobacterales bacterium]